LTESDKHPQNSPSLENLALLQSGRGFFISTPGERSLFNSRCVSLFAASPGTNSALPALFIAILGRPVHASAGPRR
jgi:hypothetical protein